jgi:hypothetical protein
VKQIGDTTRPSNPTVRLRTHESPHRDHTDAGSMEHHA